MHAMTTAIAYHSISLRRVGAMGGTIRPVIHHGELRVVEHNVSRNPDAARVLLAQQQPLLITPLDVTATIECTREEERALVRAEPRLELMLAHWRRARGDVALCLGLPPEKPSEFVDITPGDDQ